MVNSAIGIASILTLQLVGSSPLVQPTGPENQFSAGATNARGGGQATGDVRFQATGERNFDKAPEWIRAPQPKAVGLVYPTQALRSGRNGAAEIKCILTVDGALSGCATISESPTGQGFGDAALNLTPDLNIKPAMKAGRPVATEVSINASFSAPAATIGSYIPGTDISALQPVLTNPVWSQAPSYAQVVAAYPSRARTESVGGRVSLECTLAADGHFQESCLVRNEEPVGYGFGAAAVELARMFVTSPTLSDGKSAVGANLRLPFTFSTRMLQPGQTVTGSPSLMAIPTNLELGAAFPRPARRAGVGQSRAAMDCTVAPGGSLSSCTVVRESPTGVGVAAGAMQLAPKYKVSLWSSDGLPVIGSTVRVPVSYELTVR